MPADAMTTDEVRERVNGEAGRARMEARKFRTMGDWPAEFGEPGRETMAREWDRIADALTHALAALDAVARVRTLAPVLYAERVRHIADEYAGVLSTGAVVTLHDVATRLADIGRALDGEADR